MVKYFQVNKSKSSSCCLAMCCLFAKCLRLLCNFDQITDASNGRLLYQKIEGFLGIRKCYQCGGETLVSVVKHPLRDSRSQIYFTQHYFRNSIFGTLLCLIHSTLMNSNKNISSDQAWAPDETENLIMLLYNYYENSTDTALIGACNATMEQLNRQHGNTRTAHAMRGKFNKVCLSLISKVLPDSLVVAVGRGCCN